MRPAHKFVPALALLIWLIGGSAFADQFVVLVDGWKTYVNDRYGESFDYPAKIFTPDTPPENGDGQSFEAGAATLKIFAYYNIDNSTPSSIRQQTVGSEGYSNVTYSPTGKDWLVLSGLRGTDIFYEKYAFRSDVISVFTLEYPSTEKDLYDPDFEAHREKLSAGSRRLSGFPAPPGPRLGSTKWRADAPAAPIHILAR